MLHASKFLASAGLIGALGLGGVRGAGAADLGQVTYVGYNGSLLNVIEQTAIQKGFFENHGLDVQFVHAKSAAEMASALMGGSAQFGVLSPPTTVPLDEQGECFSYKSPNAASFFNVIARKGVDLPNLAKGYPDNLADMKGKRVGVVSIGGPGQSFVESLLAQAGMTGADVTFIATSGLPTSIAAIQQAQVDFLLSYPPIQQMLEPDDFVVVADLVNSKGDPLDHLIQSFSGTTCDYAQKNPQVVKAFCSGIWDAYDYANDPANDEGMAQVVAKMLTVGPEVARAIWQDYRAIVPSPVIDAARWQAQTPFLRKEGAKMPDYATRVDAACAVDDPRK